MGCFSKQFYLQVDKKKDFLFSFRWGVSGCFYFYFAPLIPMLDATSGQYSKFPKNARLSLKDLAQKGFTGTWMGYKG
jgi:hypothetical protein